MRLPTLSPYVAIGSLPVLIYLVTGSWLLTQVCFWIGVAVIAFGPVDPHPQKLSPTFWLLYMFGLIALCIAVRMVGVIK